MHLLEEVGLSCSGLGQFTIHGTYALLEGSDAETVFADSLRLTTPIKTDHEIFHLYIIGVELIVSFVGIISRLPAWRKLLAELLLEDSDKLFVQVIGVPVRPFQWLPVWHPIVIVIWAWNWRRREFFDVSSYNQPSV